MDVSAAMPPPRVRVDLLEGRAYGVGDLLLAAWLRLVAGESDEPGAPPAVGQDPDGVAGLPMAG